MEHNYEKSSLLSYLQLSFISSLKIQPTLRVKARIALGLILSYNARLFEYTVKLNALLTIVDIFLRCFIRYFFFDYRVFLE